MRFQRKLDISPNRYPALDLSTRRFRSLPLPPRHFVVGPLLSTYQVQYCCRDSGWFSQLVARLRLLAKFLVLVFLAVYTMPFVLRRTEAELGRYDFFMSA